MSLLNRFREFLDARREHDAVAEECSSTSSGKSSTTSTRACHRRLRAARRCGTSAASSASANARATSAPARGFADFRASWLDWKLGGRMLLRYPGLSIISGITLAAAMALGAGFFEFSWEMRDSKLPLADGRSDRAARELRRGCEQDRAALRARLPGVAGAARVHRAARCVPRDRAKPHHADGRSEPVEVAEISPVAFPLTRVPPLLGRPLLEADAAPARRTWS
jgi:hypothetical protein